ncbi:MAG: DUF5671 domain-containing protein [Chloroflexota bacterium]
MLNFRRLYVYLISAVSLQAVTWAIIALCRNLLLSSLEPSVSATAFQISVIIIGLPIFLGHWLWGNRQVTQSVEERRDVLRYIYLYGMMAALLIPWVVGAFDLLGILLSVDLTTFGSRYGLSDGEAVGYHLIAMIVLGALWFYHYQVVRDEARHTPITTVGSIVRRIYILGFSAAGLTMVTLGLIELVRWFMFLLDDVIISDSAVDVDLAVAIIRLIIGLPVWLIFWYQAQRLFNQRSEAERDSILRKIYLYGAVFVGVVGTVASGTTILAGLFQSLLGLTTEGDIRVPLSIIIGMLLLWGFHAILLREDEKRLPEASQQKGVRRLYLYLVAGVGLAVLLTGIAGDISVMIQTLDSGFGDGLREELAWFASATIAGLFVWPWPWRQAQNETLIQDEPGRGARQSVARKIYLYFYLLVSTLTALGGIIFVVAGLLTWILGGDPPTWSGLGHAIAFSLIALVVWLYHGRLLLLDNRLLGQAAVKRLEDLRLVVLEAEGQSLGQAVVEMLKQEAPTIDIAPISILADKQPDKKTLSRLSEAEVIVAPWEIALVADKASTTISQAIVQSSARKLLTPTIVSNWDWVGVESLDKEETVQRTVEAIKQIAANERVGHHKSWGLGSIIATIIGLFVVFILIVIPIITFFASNF